MIYCNVISFDQAPCFRCLVVMRCSSTARLVSIVGGVCLRCCRIANHCFAEPYSPPRNSTLRRLWPGYSIKLPYFQKQSKHSNRRTRQMFARNEPNPRTLGRIHVRNGWRRSLSIYPLQILSQTPGRKRGNPTTSLPSFPDSKQLPQRAPVLALPGAQRVVDQKRAGRG